MIRSVWLKALASIALLAWLLARTPLAALANELTRLDAVTLVLGAALSLIAWCLSAVRLWCIAPEFRLTEVIRISFIALFYGTVLPGQVAGDVVKAYRLSGLQSHGGQAVAATLIDRGVAMLALFLIGAGAAMQLPQVPGGLRVVLWIACVGLLCGGALLALTRVRNRLVALVQNDGSGRIARAFAFLQRLAHALHDAIRHPGRIMLCLVLAMVFHAICIAIHVLLGHALGLDLGIAVWCVVYAGVSVLMLLPISVAGIGLREGGYLGLLAFFGVNRETALALSFAFFGYLLFGALLGGATELLQVMRARRKGGVMNLNDPRLRAFRQEGLITQLKLAGFVAGQPHWWVVAGLLGTVWLAVLVGLCSAPRTGAIIEMQLQSDQAGVAQWFYDKGNGYSESESVTAALHVGSNDVTFRLPLGTYQGLRFDPINNDGRVTVHNLRWVTTAIINTSALGKENLVQLANIAHVERQSGGVTIQPVTGSNDPQMTLLMEEPLRLVQDSTLDSDMITAFELACGLLLLLWIVCTKIAPQGLIVAGMGLAAGLILAMALLSTTKHSVHPDELSHFTALHYFSEHWLPPAIDDPAVIPSLSVYGSSYLSELDVTYPIAARVISPMIAFAGSEIMAARLFQGLLWSILCLCALHKKAWAIPLCVVLLSPQIWYVFSYFNGDAFPLFLTLIASLLLCDRDSGVHAYILGKRGFGSATLIFTLCLGLLLVSKLNYLPVIPGLLLWLAVLYLDLRWRELLAVLCSLVLVGFGVFARGLPSLTAWRGPMLLVALGMLCFLYATSAVMLRCYRHTALQRALIRILLIVGVTIVIAVPRVGQDIWVNGSPETKSAKMLAVAETHAGAEFKPSVIAQDNGYATLHLARKGAGLSQILFEPHEWGKISVVSAFGVYGYMNIFASMGLYWLLFVSVFLLVGIALLALLHAAPAHAGRLLIVAAGICGLIAFSSLMHSWTNDFQAQGRYLLPMAGMFALVLGHAADKLPERIFKVLVLAALALSISSFAGVALPALAHPG